MHLHLGKQWKYGLPPSYQKVRILNCGLFDFRQWYPPFLDFVHFVWHFSFWLLPLAKFSGPFLIKKIGMWYMKSKYEFKSFMSISFRFITKVWCIIFQSCFITEKHERVSILCYIGFQSFTQKYHLFFTHVHTLHRFFNGGILGLTLFWEWYSVLLQG